MVFDCFCNDVKERVAGHLDVPVCRTLTGLKIHLATISLSEKWWLCFQFKCDSVESLVKIMWSMIKTRKDAARAARLNRPACAPVEPKPPPCEDLWEHEITEDDRRLANNKVEQRRKEA